jgi:hypothetical protein
LKEVTKKSVQTRLKVFRTITQAAQHNKFKKLIQKFNKKYLGKSINGHKKDSMEKGQLKYKETHHEKTVE